MAEFGALSQGVLGPAPTALPSIPAPCLQQDPELVKVSFLCPWLPGILTKRDFTPVHTVALRRRRQQSGCSQPQQRGCGGGEWTEGQPQPCHAPRVALLSGGGCWGDSTLTGPCSPSRGAAVDALPCPEEGLDPVTPTPVSSAVSDGGVAPLHIGVG